jgi:arylsulfatase A-like enzyme
MGAIKIKLKISTIKRVFHRQIQKTINSSKVHLFKRKQMNTLLILVDQLRYDIFSHRGNNIIHTPNIDKLAESGVLFTDAICSSPLCGPSRASLLTGTFGYTGNYLYHNREADEESLFNKKLFTGDEVLAASGYVVHYHGKWHTGNEHLDCYKNPSLFGHKIKPYHDYLYERYEKPEVGGDTKIDAYTKWPYHTLSVDSKMRTASDMGVSMPHHPEAGVIDVKDEDTLTAWTVTKTINFLKSKPSNPFAVTCSIFHPHAPLICNSKYADMYDPKQMPMPQNIESTHEKKPPVPQGVSADASGVGQFMALYYGLVKEVDNWVGQLLNTLENEGLTENTMVILTADHGELMGSHRTFSKGRPYEECLRVPLIISYPAKISKGIRLKTPVSGADIVPTILDYAGIPALDQFHGRSLKPAIEGGDFQRKYAYSELLRGNIKTGLYGSQFLRSDRWKYSRTTDIDGKIIEQFLFDLKNDPYELINIAKTNVQTIEIQLVIKEMNVLLNRKYSLGNGRVIY